MRCLSCSGWSFAYLCRHCRQTLLRPQPSHRRLSGDLVVFSFYAYESIEPLLQAKYHPFGTRILRHLAHASLRPFFRDLALQTPAALVAIDDQPGEWFSHSATLARHAKTRQLPYHPATLHATNRVRYAGKDLAFRKAHPRNFRFRRFEESSAILIDDVITTGSTLQEAATVLQKHQKEVLFAVTLADAARS